MATRPGRRPCRPDRCGAPTAAQTAAAKAKAEAAVKDLQGGKSWEDVAKTVSTDTATAAQAGDLGFLTSDDLEALETAVRRYLRL